MKKMTNQELKDMIGRLGGDFHNACLKVGIPGAKFGMFLLLCQPLSKSLFWIQIEKERRYCYATTRIITWADPVFRLMQILLMILCFSFIAPKIYIKDMCGSLCDNHVDVFDRG